MFKENAVILLISIVVIWYRPYRQSKLYELVLAETRKSYTFYTPILVTSLCSGHQKILPSWRDRDREVVVSFALHMHTRFQVLF